MAQSIPPDKPTQSSNGILSPLSKVNLVVICIVVLIYSALMLTEFLPNIVILLAATLTLAYLLLGPVCFIEFQLGKLLPKRWTQSGKLARTLAILIVYLMLLGLMVIAVFRVALPISMQMKQYARDLPSYISKVTETPHQQPPAAELGQLIRESLDTSEPAPTAAQLHANKQFRALKKHPAHAKARVLKTASRLAMQKLADLSKTFASKLASYVVNIGTSTLAGVVYMLTVLVLVFYLLHGGVELRNGLISLMPTRHEAVMQQFLDRLHHQFYSIVKGQVVMSFLAGSLMYVLLLGLGAKYALLLGVVFGLTSILPVIGPWLGLVPVTVTVELGHHPVNILYVFLGIAVFYLLKTYWLWPKLIHKKYDVHPLLFVLTFVACLKVVGFWGVLLSFPLASILGVVLEFLKLRQARKTPHSQPAP